jgi:hypothetical protein
MSLQSAVTVRAVLRVFRRSRVKVTTPAVLQLFLGRAKQNAFAAHRSYVMKVGRRSRSHYYVKLPISMDIEAFIRRHPVLWHMAEAGAWPKMQRQGLLSTTALLDLFEYSGEERRRIESARRTESIEIGYRDHDTAIIRDNLPLREQFLAKSLEDMTASEWYELLNRKTFFWVSKERLQRLLGARAYRNRAHDVVAVETRRLVERDLDRITLAAINTGATLYPSAPQRGRNTFQRIQDYDLDAVVRRRGRKDAIVELAVDYAVRDIEEVAFLVERWFRNQVCEVLWERSSG